MPILPEEVEVGWLYCTPQKQQRVVLGCNSKGQVVYAVRGDGIHDWQQHEEVKIEGFAEACDDKVSKICAEKFNEIINKCHAKNKIVEDGNCFLKKPKLSVDRTIT